MTIPIKSLLLTVLLVFGSGQIGYAQEEENLFEFKAREFALAEYGLFRIQVDDQVRDGCWPNPSATANAVQLKLQKNNIVVLGPAAGGPILEVRVRGNAGSDGRCLIVWDLKVFKTLAVQQYMTGEESKVIKGAGVFVLWSSNGAFTRRKSEAAEILKTAVLDSIDKLLVTYFDAVDEMKSIDSDLEWQWVPPDN